MMAARPLSQWRTIGDDGCTALIVQLIDSVLHKQQLGIAGTGQTMLKTAILLKFTTDSLF